jgi:diaminopimelate epimerase
MTYFNADGGEASMCGNGARCSVAFARRLGLIDGPCRFSSGSGLLTGEVLGPDQVEVSLPTWRDLELDVALAGSPFPTHHRCHTGVPHLIIPVADVAEVDLATWGPQLRGNPAFGLEGTNVDWVAPSPEGGSWLIRTYERGVEDETLACGTGASAAAVVLCHLGLAESPVSLRTRGADLLVVSVDTVDKQLRLRGPAVTSFQGEVTIDE